MATYLDRERQIVEEGRKRGLSDDFIKQAVIRDRQSRVDSKTQSVNKPQVTTPTPQPTKPPIQVKQYAPSMKEKFTNGLMSVADKINQFSGLKKYSESVGAAMGTRPISDLHSTRETAGSAAQGIASLASLGMGAPAKIGGRALQAALTGALAGGGKSMETSSNPSDWSKGLLTGGAIGAVTVPATELPIAGAKKVMGSASKAVYNKLIPTPLKEVAAGRGLIGEELLRRGVKGSYNQMAQQVGNIANQAGTKIEQVVEANKNKLVDTTPVVAVLLRLKKQLLNTPGESTNAINNVIDDFLNTQHATTQDIIESKKLVTASGNKLKDISMNPRMPETGNIEPGSVVDIKNHRTNTMRLTSGDQIDLTKNPHNYLNETVSGQPIDIKKPQSYPQYTDKPSTPKSRYETRIATKEKRQQNIQNIKDETPNKKITTVKGQEKFEYQYPKYEEPKTTPKGRLEVRQAEKNAQIAQANKGAATVKSNSPQYRNPKQLTLPQAQELKQNLQKAVNDAFLNQNVKGKTMIQKKAAQELRNTIESIVPDIAGPNANYAFSQRAGKAVAKASNRSSSPWRVPTELGLGGAAALMHNPLLLALIGGERVLTTPKVSSNLAQGAYKLSNKTTDPIKNALIRRLIGQGLSRTANASSPQ